MNSTLHDRAPHRPDSLASTSRRSGREVPWLWAAYLFGSCSVVLVLALWSYDMARGAGDDDAWQWAYVALGAAVMLAAAGLTLRFWRRLPALTAAVPGTVQLLAGVVLAEAAGLLGMGSASAISAWRYSQLPPPVDTSFMQYFVTADLVAAGLGAIGITVTLALMRGSRAALVCTLIAQIPVAAAVVLGLVASYHGTHEELPTAPLIWLVFLVPFVLAVLPSTWAWTGEQRRSGPSAR